MILALGAAGVAITLCVLADGSMPSFTFDADGLPTFPPVEVYNQTERIYNPEAVVPQQCYTDTKGIHNPCFTCHQSHSFSEDRLNFANDGYLQGDYDFSELATNNHWTNAFEDNTALLDAISDESILSYVRQDNYAALESESKAVPSHAYVPDLNGFGLGSAAFGLHGIALDGSHWVAYSYKPFPGVFWPTNGNFDDAAIRLPQEFRSLGGEYDRDTYLLNLSLLELSIKGLHMIPIPTVSETRLNEDVNGDGEITGDVQQLGRRSSYFGDASSLRVRRQQYPQGTEFLHSLRYLDVDPESGTVKAAPRMKELRYMKKLSVLDEGQNHSRYIDAEIDKSNGVLPQYPYLESVGMVNPYGWALTGFIEDTAGRLRRQTFEENLYCMGCHSAIGATIDQTFSFPRKRPGPAGWAYVDLQGMPDVPARGRRRGEIREYLELVSGGDEYRENTEMKERWLDSKGRPDERRIAAATDVYDLIVPSPERALRLNKAYLVIVRRQRFVFGRDAALAVATNILREVNPDEMVPLQPGKQRISWDLRLDWHGGTASPAPPSQCISEEEKKTTNEAGTP